MSELNAIDVNALKAAAEAKLSAMAPTTEEPSKTDEVETKSTIDTEKKTEKMRKITRVRMMKIRDALPR